MKEVSADSVSPPLGGAEGGHGGTAAPSPHVHVQSRRPVSSQGEHRHQDNAGSDSILNKGYFSSLIAFTGDILSCFEVKKYIPNKRFNIFQCMLT